MKKINCLNLCFSLSFSLSPSRFSSGAWLNFRFQKEIKAATFFLCSARFERWKFEFSRKEKVNEYNVEWCC